MDPLQITILGPLKEKFHLPDEFEELADIQSFYKRLHGTRHVEVSPQKTQCRVTLHFHTTHDRQIALDYFTTMGFMENHEEMYYHPTNSYQIGATFGLNSLKDYENEISLVLTHYPKKLKALSAEKFIELISEEYATKGIHLTDPNRNYVKIVDHIRDILLTNGKHKKDLVDYLETIHNKFAQLIGIKSENIQPSNDTTAKILQICKEWIKDERGNDCFWEGWPECPSEGILTPNMLLEILTTPNDKNPAMNSNKPEKSSEKLITALKHSIQDSYQFTISPKDGQKVEDFRCEIINATKYVLTQGKTFYAVSTREDEQVLHIVTYAGEKVNINRNCVAYAQPVDLIYASGNATKAYTKNVEDYEKVFAYELYETPVGSIITASAAHKQTVQEGLTLLKAWRVIK